MKFCFMNKYLKIRTFADDSGLCTIFKHSMFITLMVDKVDIRKENCKQELRKLNIRTLNSFSN